MADALTIGGWVASPVIDRLVDKLGSFIGKQYEYQNTDIKRSLKTLKGYLQKVRAAVHAAEKKDIESKSLREWLVDLKDALYAAEDLIDLIEYKDLKATVSSNLASTSRASPFPKKFCKRVASPFRKLYKRTRTVGKRLLFSDDEINDILSMTETFEKIVAEMGLFVELIELEPSVAAKASDIMEKRQTSSDPIEPEVFGRDSEIAHVVELLLGTGRNIGSSTTKNSVGVLPIVGIGGVGKTTLAQCVYSDKRVKAHFDLMAWVCVSDKFDVKKLTKEIVESAKINKPDDFHNIQNLDRIQEILTIGLEEKKFLIVLDDVWTEDTESWRKLRSAFKSGKEGSMIISTTRNQEIADMMGTMEAIRLNGLSDKVFRNFFVNCAFGDKNPENHPELKSIAEKIAEKS